VGLTLQPLLVPKVLEKSRVIPLLTLRACVAYKKNETYLPYAMTWVVNKKMVSEFSFQASC